MPENRDKTGKFKKGHSGNPGGRPKTPEEIKELFMLNTPKAVEKLLIMLDNDELHPQVKLNAIKEILDRALGKASQKQDIDIKGEMTNVNYNSEEERRVELEKIAKALESRKK